MDQQLGPRLTIVDGTNATTTFLIPHDEVVIGSGPEAYIPLRHEGVSRRHAVLIRDAGSVMINDLGSLNGTWINGRRTAGPTPLEDDDLLQFGTLKMRFSCDASIRTEMRNHTLGPSATAHGSAHHKNSTATRSHFSGTPEESGRMPLEREAVIPWYRRSKNFLIATGAVAAALGSVFTLWNIIFTDPADIATIKSLHITARTPLHEFPSELVNKDLTLDANAHAALLDDRSHPTRLFFTPLQQVVPTPPPHGAVQGSTTRTSGLMKAAVFTDIPTTPPDPNPTETSAPTISPTAPTQTSTHSPSPSEVSIFGYPSEEYQFDVEEELRSSNVAPELARSMSYITTIDYIADDGQQIPPDQVAERLITALVEVETEDGNQSLDQNSQPMGWTVSVGIDLEGLANVPLLMTWSLDGVDISATWQAENLAYRIVASTQHDAGVARIWVPDLNRAGPYNVNVRLTYESTATIAAEGHLRLPNE